MSSSATTTTSSLGLNMATLRTTLPFLTGAMNTLGIFSGLYFILSPSEGAKIFGIPFKKDSSPTPTELAYTRIHGFRDLALGFVGLKIINEAYVLERLGNPVGARALGNVVGSLLIAGAVFGLGDAWVVSDYAGREEGELVEGDDREMARNLGLSHVAVAVPAALLGLAWYYI